MPRKVIIDCDPGIDDAVALCMALFDPRLEVVGVTATAGNVDADQSTRNMLAVLQAIDPPKWPRIGVAEVSDRVPVADGRRIHGDDGLGEAGYIGSELHNSRPADRVINDVVRDSPGDVTIITLGPLTNLAMALQRDREMVTMIDRIIMVGGTVSGVGDISPCAEFNMFFDPQAAREIFRSPTTKTLLPLELTRQVTWTLDFLNELPSATTRVGAFLRKTVPFLFRSHRQELGEEVISLHALLGILAAVQPELLETSDMIGDVEIDGELTRGATIFDRRIRSPQRKNMEVAREVDVAAAKDDILRSLKFAGQST